MVRLFRSRLPLAATRPYIKTMNRRELFKLCGQLAAALACVQVARVLPESKPTITAGRFKAAALWGRPGSVTLTPSDLAGITDAAKALDYDHLCASLLEFHKAALSASSQ